MNGRCVREPNEKATVAEYDEEQNNILLAGSEKNRLGLAMVPLRHGTGAPFDEHKRSLRTKNKMY